MASLYIHIPFCEKKCFFCSFAVSVSQMHYRERYLEALRTEASRYGKPSVDSIYVGGGTPSCLEVSHVRALFDMIRERFLFEGFPEVTFEINPESLDEEKAAFLQKVGVNRASLGIQSLNDERLNALGRAHSAAQAVRAYRVLRDAGFRNINVDVMYGLPGETEAELRKELDVFLALEPDHVSIYSLTVEERSLFFARKLRVEPEMQGNAYEIVRTTLEAGGLAQYEISNFSRAGRQSYHNLNYWRGGEYYGLGMSAHSHLDGRRFWNTDKLPDYLRLIFERDGNAQAGEERLSPEDKFMEIFLFGLRMNEGVDLDELQRRMGVELPVDRAEAIENFVEMGLLTEKRGRIVATDRGRLVLDEISARLI